MLLQCAAMAAKNLLMTFNSFCETNMSPGCYTQLVKRCHREMKKGKSQIGVN